MPYEHTLTPGLCYLTSSPEKNKRLPNIGHINTSLWRCKLEDEPRHNFKVCRMEAMEYGNTRASSCSQGSKKPGIPRRGHLSLFCTQKLKNSNVLDSDCMLLIKTSAWFINQSLFPRESIWGPVVTVPRLRRAFSFTPR